MHDFASVLSLAQSGDSEAMLIVLKKIDPLLRKNSMIFQQFDEDLYQDLIVQAINAIMVFR